MPSKYSKSPKKHLEKHKWPKGKSGNPKGRPKSMLNKMRESLGVDLGIEVTKGDIKTVIQSILCLTIPELQKLVKDSKTPAMVVGMATAIIKDANAGKITTVDSLLDRVYGRPSQEIEQIIMNKVNLPDPPPKPNKNGKLAGSKSPE